MIKKEYFSSLVFLNKNQKHIDTTKYTMLPNTMFQYKYTLLATMLKSA